jgi:hypothetical protein
VPLTIAVLSLVRDVSEPIMTTHAPAAGHFGKPITGTAATKPTKPVSGSESAHVSTGFGSALAKAIGGGAKSVAGSAPKKA